MYSSFILSDLGRRYHLPRRVGRPQISEQSLPPPSAFNSAGGSEPEDRRLGGGQNHLSRRRSQTDIPEGQSHRDHQEKAGRAYRDYSSTLLRGKSTFVVRGLLLYLPGLDI